MNEIKKIKMVDLQKKLSKATKVITPSVSMAVNEKAKEMKSEGVEIINLSIGEPDFDTPSELKKEGIDAINKNITHYSSSRGLPELLKAVSDKLRKENKFETNPIKNILITPGVKQALFYLNCCLINKGDEAIIFEPYWVTYVDSLKLCGGTPIFAVGKEKYDFKPSLDDIEKKITKKTKYILFSNPCNPSGALWSKEELYKILNVAKKYNLLIIADEIYEKIVFDKEFVSLASLDGAENYVITLNGFSKSASMTGWRVGFIAGPEIIINAALTIQETIATCVSPICQKAAVNAFQQKKEIKNMIDSYKRRKDFLIPGINKIKGFSCKMPHGTFYAFVNISELSLKSIEASTEILEKARVAVVPGIAYGKNFDNYIRISFATSDENLRKALQNLSEVYGWKL